MILGAFLLVPAQVKADNTVNTGNNSTIQLATEMKKSSYGKKDKYHKMKMYKCPEMMELHKKMNALYTKKLELKDKMLDLKIQKYELKKEMNQVKREKMQLKQKMMEKWQEKQDVKDSTEQKAAL